jgi:hypothetical protein
MKNAISRIEYGELLLGMMHGFGMAPDVEPAAGTLYINARSIIEGNYLREMVVPADVGSGMPRQAALRDQFRSLDVYVSRWCITHQNYQEISHNILGAAAWIGDPEVLPEDLINPMQWYGANVAKAVTDAQRDIEAVIIQRLKCAIIWDQTKVANMVLGLPPNDARYCWLVSPNLGERLKSQKGAIVHQITDTYWWQQEQRLTPDTNLLTNPILQRIASQMIGKRW